MTHAKIQFFKPLWGFLSRRMSVHSKEFSYVSPIPKDRYQDVTAHLRVNIFADEPLNKCLDIFKKGEPQKDLETLINTVLKETLSVMLVDKETGTNAGVLLNCLYLPATVEEKKRFSDSVSCDKFKRIVTHIYEVNKPLQLFPKFDNFESGCDWSVLRKGLKICWIEVIHEIKYVHYLDENKRPIFKVDPPHDAIRVLLK
ncbi:uncharacterized protein LOC128985050 [Macrosteles quadrilineatus]|uniref:uncharacterized protein LOC128985050 n=1 Tax=Macrosteles quadrilineatus TaxID=74068 RepID=UPI0023E2D106|nr:uncharacterized protein LOC128985050 [Macrosteles quadrilineatus]